MSNRTKLVVGVGVLALVALCTILLQRSQQQNQTLEHTKVGVILPLSGDLAIIGSEIQRGIELARDELVAQGDAPQVIYEDDQSLNSAAAVSAARKLTAIDQIDVGLTAIVEEAQPVGPVFHEAQIPLLVTWDSNHLIQEMSNRVFSIGFSTELTSEKMAAYAFNELGLRKIAVIQHRSPWSEIAGPAFINKFKSLGGEVVFDTAVQVTETDYRTPIAQMKAVEPDGVFFALIPPTNEQFIIQARQLGLEATLLTGDPLLIDIIEAVSPVANGIYYTNFFTDQEAALTAKYQAKYGEDPGDIALVSFGYDGLMTIKEAIDHSGTGNIHEGLESITGPTRAANRIEKIYRVENDIPIPVE